MTRSRISRADDDVDSLGVDEIAAAADTIAYELLCQVTARVPRQLNDGQ